MTTTFMIRWATTEECRPMVEWLRERDLKLTTREVYVSTSDLKHPGSETYLVFATADDMVAVSFKLMFSDLIAFTEFGLDLPEDRIEYGNGRMSR